LSENALLSEAVEALLASSQRSFPVVDATQTPVGLLDRDDLVLSLKEKGPDATVSSVMRKPAVISGAVPLNDAVTDMNWQGLRSQIVVDGGGRLAGMLTLENVAEMMMIHAIRPEWKFAHQAK
jgi:stage IV sporulation protein FB